MMSLEHPFGAAMLVALAGNPTGLSKIQNDSIYGSSSERGVTKEIFKFAALRKIISLAHMKLSRAREQAPGTYETEPRAGASARHI